MHIAARSSHSQSSMGLPLSRMTSFHCNFSRLLPWLVWKMLIGASTITSAFVVVPVSPSNHGLPRSGPISSIGSKSSRLYFGLSSIEKQEKQYLELAMKHSHDAVVWPETVHIIVYNPNTELEGVHVTEFPPGSGEQTLLAFESASECQHFSDVIMVGQPGDLADPVPTQYTLTQMIQYCHDMNWSLQLVPDMEQ
jgi:Protein of unknown function (DUF3110)